ncbi:MAG: hypothetical protein HC890_11220 [Chloroflexaceae bacterium]|nr:hypothetical protein [Chloroflexaceae bacterium]
MPRQPDEYAVHLFLSSGHKEDIRFASIQDFQKWYSNQLVPKSASTELMNVPIKNIQGEYMVIRPSCVVAIRVEPVFFGSVDRYDEEDEA